MVLPRVESIARGAADQATHEQATHEQATHEQATSSKKTFCSREDQIGDVEADNAWADGRRAGNEHPATPHGSLSDSVVADLLTMPSGG